MFVASWGGWGIKPQETSKINEVNQVQLINEKKVMSSGQVFFLLILPAWNMGLQQPWLFYTMGLGCIIVACGIIKASETPKC